jgi:hypothetical protein
VGVPVLLVGKRLIDTVVEVFVVGEDDMAADVVELWFEALVSVGGIGSMALNLRSLRV